MATALEKEVSIGADAVEAHEAVNLLQQRDDDNHAAFLAGDKPSKLLDGDGEAETVTSTDTRAADEIDFSNANIRGQTGSATESTVWNADFLEFSKWMRNKYFKDTKIKEMQSMNRANFVNMLFAVAAQVGSYAFCRVYYPQYWMLWAFPLFLLHIWLVQFGEIVHTRAHWPRNMTGSDAMDSFVDCAAIVLTGTSKESFRRRHIVAHYSDVANMARVFSDLWLPFVQFPATFYLVPHRLFTIFMDVEYCKRENLSRKQLLIEMVEFYAYLALMVYEAVYLKSCFLCVFHLGCSIFYYGAQVMGAMGAHSGIDKRNSFNSNGLFDWREAKGLWALTIWFIDLFANGGLSNHGLHHAHTQIPLHVINKNLRELNQYALENFENVRYNRVLAHNLHGDLLEKMPPPRWYDYIGQFCFNFSMLVLAGLVIAGMPLPPPLVFEILWIDYRFFFYNSTSDYYARIVRMHECLEIVARKRTLVNPNAYFALTYKRCAMMRAHLKKHPAPNPPPPVEEFKYRVCPKEVYEFNIVPFLKEAKEKGYPTGMEAMEQDDALHNKKDN